MAVQEDPPSFSGLVADLEVLVGGGPSQKPPDPLVCFDLLSKLLVAIEFETKETLCAWQRKCEDALQMLLLLGTRPPIRRLVSTAVVRLIEKGDYISIYSRISSLQAWFSDKQDRKYEPVAFVGAAHCLGALNRAFGQKVTSGLVETASIVAKLMRSPEVSIKHAALNLLQDAIDGMKGGGSAQSYAEIVKIIMKAPTDKSHLVRAAAAGCIRALAVAGGPGLVGPGLESAALLCVKGLEDPSQQVRDGFAAALGALLALAYNPDKQVVPRGKASEKPVVPKTLEGGVPKYLMVPFTKAVGPRAMDVRMGMAMAWVAFLQGMRLTYGTSDMELPSYGAQAITMLSSGPKDKAVIDVHAQACVLYIVRVGIVEQTGEAAQKELTSLLVKLLADADKKDPPMLVVTMRLLTYLLSTLGEVTADARAALDESLVGILAHASPAVRMEAARTLRALAMVDPSCVDGLMSAGVTTLRALREMKSEADALHGQAAMLAALLSASPRLPLGIPSRLPLAILDVAKQMVMQPAKTAPNAAAIVAAEREAGWMLVGALVASLPKEELEEHELDLLGLWTLPFGGNCELRLKTTMESGPALLAMELSGWAAAMEALTAFIRFHIVPNMSAVNEGILVSPVLGILSGALVYLASTALQELAAVKPMVDLFTIRTLEAYRTLPDPFTYKSDHIALLGICTLPYRAVTTTPPSSCLRQLLDHRDASLGPWVPGRDSLEDELRAFEGGADGPLPAMWEFDAPFFPQPLPLAIVLADSMLLCFGTLFAAQSEKHKLQLLDMVLNSMKISRKMPWRYANTTNVCVALLSGLKWSVTFRNTGGPEVELWRKAQTVVQNILAADSASLAIRRAAAEALGLLARVGDDTFAVRLARSLLAEAAGTSEAAQKGAIALALGCVHRSVGGMTLSMLVPPTVQALCQLAKDATDGLHVWALHALWLTADAAGLSYVPHVQATLALCMDMLLSEEHTAPELRQSVGRLVNAMVAVLGPELVPGSSVFARCKSIVAEIGTADEPAAQLECVLYAQQLVVFAPQAVPAHVHVATLRSTLSSRQPMLRSAAVATLRHLAERDPAAMVDVRIEEDLFAMLDNETDAGIIRDVQLTLERLLEAAAPVCPSRWLRLCRNVVLAASSTRTAGGGSPPTSPTAEKAAGEASTADSTLGDRDEEGMVSRTGSATGVAGPGKVESRAPEVEQLPRYRTRVFAAECLGRLPMAVGSAPEHFDLELAREDRQLALSRGSPSPDWLVLHLTELVALAFQVATSTMETVRPAGVSLLNTILFRFGQTEDPEYEGHLLLEQYQAQYISAVRTSFELGATPLLMASGAQLAARIVTSGLSGGDRTVLQRVISLLSGPLAKWEELSHPSYAEWVGCRVRVSLLAGQAALKCFAVSALKRRAQSTPVSKEASPTDAAAVLPLLRQHAGFLGRCWVGLLSDYVVSRSQPPNVQAMYKPFLLAARSAAAAATVQPYLEESWVPVLLAVTGDAVPKPEGTPPETSSAPGTPVRSGRVFSEPESEQGGCSLAPSDFDKLWALALLVLCEGAEPISDMFSTDGSLAGTSTVGSPTARSQRRSFVAATASQDKDPQQVALSALKSLSTAAFFRADMLSVDLTRELLQILLDLEVARRPTIQQMVAEILEQVVVGAPLDYLNNTELSFCAAELGMSYIHRLLGSDTAMGHTARPLGTEEETAFATVTKAMGQLAVRLTPQGQAMLIPQVLCGATRALKVAPTGGSPLTSVLGLVTALATANSTKSTGGRVVGSDAWESQRPFVLAAAVESVAAMADRQISGSFRRASQSEGCAPESEAETSKRLPIVLGVMALLAGEVSDRGQDEKSLRDAARGRCIGCLRTALSSSNVATQMAGLQTVRTVVHAGVAEQPRGKSCAWALQCMLELGSDISTIVYNAVQTPMTPPVASAVGESLKLFVLLHSVVEGDAQQQEILHVLLPTIIAAATPHPSGPSAPQVTLASVAVKLVTHLASVPSSAAQFRTVLAALPAQSKQELQAIIKASVTPATTTSAPSSIAQSQPGAIGKPKLLVPLPTTGGYIPPAPKAKLPPLPKRPSFKRRSIEEGSIDDDDWDTPQVETADSSKAEKDTATPPEQIARKLSTNDEDDNEDEWGDFPEPGGTAAVPSTSEPPKREQTAEEDEDDWGDFPEPAPKPAASDNAGGSGQGWGEFPEPAAARAPVSNDAGGSDQDWGEFPEPAAKASVSNKEGADDDWGDFPEPAPAASVAVASSAGPPAGEMKGLEEDEGGDWAEFKGPRRDSVAVETAEPPAAAVVPDGGEGVSGGIVEENDSVAAPAEAADLDKPPSASFGGDSTREEGEASHLSLSEQEEGEGRLPGGEDEVSLGEGQIKVVEKGDGSREAEGGEKGCIPDKNGRPSVVETTGLAVENGDSAIPSVSAASELTTGAESAEGSGAANGGESESLEVDGKGESGVSFARSDASGSEGGDADVKAVDPTAGSTPLGSEKGEVVTGAMEKITDVAAAASVVKGETLEDVVSGSMEEVAAVEGERGSGAGSRSGDAPVMSQPEVSAADGPSSAVPSVLATEESGKDGSDSPGAGAPSL